MKKQPEHKDAPQSAPVLPTAPANSTGEELSQEMLDAIAGGLARTLVRRVMPGSKDKL